ncbi:MAG: S-formylglutathione hydrolase [Halieaceae bacterium]|jgi:S-formylglutathione hydrolase
MALQLIGDARCFGGRQLRYSHHSEALNCEMKFSVYLPPEAENTAVPALYWLSGLTCTDENFVIKGGAQRYAAENGVAIVCPDTSPRGESVVDDADGAYDFGLGAGFYVNATESPWADHYQMYSYVVDELPSLINSNCPVASDRVSIWGHSMGGHGALTIALRNPGKYRSCSAFAPICAPSECPWGQKALGAYLGGDRQRWLDHDAVALVRSAKHRLPVLVDQGDADNFLEEQLKTQMLMAACRDVDFPMEIRMQAGYDHSFFFISTFIEEHIKFHVGHLAA